MSDPAKIAAVGNVQIDRATDVVVAGTTAYVVAADSATKKPAFLTVVDVSDPSMPVVANNVLDTFADPIAIGISSGLLMVTVGNEAGKDNDDSLFIFDPCP